MPKTIYYVTGNRSKFNLFSQFVPPHARFVLEQFDYPLFEEQIEDQGAIARSKAQQAWEQLKKPVLVDEVGVYFEQYRNFPGAFTKFVYKGLGFDGISKLMNDGDEMSILLHVVYQFGPDQYQEFSVRVYGTYKKPVSTIDTNAPFDAVFVPKGLDKTYDELATDHALYNKVYFRSIVMNEIVTFIEQND